MLKANILIFVIKNMFSLGIKRVVKNRIFRYFKYNISVTIGILIDELINAFPNSLIVL